MFTCKLVAVKLVLTLEIILIAMTMSYPIDKDPNGNAIITKYLFDKKENGEYHYEYETSDGQSKTEHGQIITQDGKSELYVYGSYSYVGADGMKYVVNYGAGRNGFVINPTFPGFAPSAVTEKGISSAALASLAGGVVGK